MQTRHTAGSRHTSAAVADGLRSDILSGRLPPNTPVTERSMVDTYGLSRSAVREVLTLLISEGYLERRPHHSARVRAYTSKAVHDILEARWVVERYAAETCGRAQPQARQDVRDALHRYAAAAGSSTADRALAGRRHRELHVALVALTDNETLTRQEEQLMVDSGLAVDVINDRRNDAPKMIQQHTELVEAYLAGDSETALALTRAHLDMVESAAHAEVAEDPDEQVRLTD